MAEIEFWYEFASTSYPAAMRIEPLAKTAGVAVRPFLLGPMANRSSIYAAKVAICGATLSGSARPTPRRSSCRQVASRRTA